MSLFISFEGGEGSGKTTQINMLASALVKQGHQVVTTREPGGTPEGEKIRSLIVQRDGGAWTPMAEALLLFAARNMHIERVIKPALAEGKIVLSDRFTDSTLAYQGYGNDFDIQKIMRLSEISIDNFSPDLTFILDIDVQAGLARSNKRLANEKGYQSTEDRFERMVQEFHERLRAGFLEIAKNNPTRCQVMDASKDTQALAQEILCIALERVRAS